MNPKTKWLAAAVLVLLAANILWRVWAGWGLITIHANAQPLAQVLASIQRQGHVTLKADLPADTPVTMHVEKVPLTEALETLAATTDARWRLAYFLAADTAAVRGAVADFSAGKMPGDWRQIYIPLPGMIPVGEDAPIPDPRRDPWNVKPPPDGTLQAYLEDAAKNTNAAFLLPAAWNPPVKSPPKSGAISSTLPRLASSAGGKTEELFILTQSRGRGGPPGGGARSGGGQPLQPGQSLAAGNNADRPRMDPDAMAERMQAEINKLPASQRAAAQARFDKDREFWKSLRDLPPDQRRAKVEQYMSDPANQQRMDDRQAKNDSRRTPEQRLQRYQRYVEQKQAFRAGGGQTQTQGGGGGGRGGWLGR